MAAIYQWFPNYFETHVLTSKLYPIEVESGLQFSGSVTAGYMQVWTEDELEGAVVILDAALVDILIDNGETEDELEGAVIILDATLVDILIDNGTTEDELEGAVIILDATLVPKLVTADTEDNGLVFSGSIIAITMDDV